MSPSDVHAAAKRVVAARLAVVAAKHDAALYALLVHS